MNVRFIRLDIEGFDENNMMQIHNIRYKSKMNSPFLIEIDCQWGGKNRIKPDSLIGKNINIKLDDSKKNRYFSGLIFNIFQSNSFSSNVSPVTQDITILVGSEMLLMKEVEHSRVLPRGNAISYIKQITGLYNLDVSGPLNTDFAEREFCIQYRESDMDFINRIMESEGIFYYFKHSTNNNQVLLGSTISDYNSEDTIHFGDQKNQVYYTNFSKEDSLLIGYNSINDFDYYAPRKSLRVEKVKSKSSVIYDNARVADYSYPYPVRSYTNSDENTMDIGRKYSSLRLDSKHTNNEKVHLQAKGIWWSIDVGSRFTVQGEDGEFVVTSYSLIINDVETANNLNNIKIKITAINAANIYRPLMKTAVPDIPVQTATVVGMADGTLYNKVDNDDDKKILVKVKFHWDLEHMPTSNECSCWIRSGQGWAGNQRGFIFAPRVGDEVIVAFESGHPDTPIIIGSVHNGKNKLPYSLAEKKNLSGIVSRTVPDGKESACILIKDDAGMEELDMYSAGDMNQLAGKNLSIKANGMLNIEASAISLNAYDPQSGKMSFITLTPELISIMSEMINENTGGAPNVIMAGEIKDKVKPGAYFGGSASSAEDAAKKMAKQEKKNEEMKAKAAKKSAKLAKKGANQGIDAAATGDVSKVTVAQDAVQTAADMGSERASGVQN